ncbi:MAG: hypothetical protein HY046_04705 [Acidobacteria bacterium]|nr:hypothetical protein [Acidobacteriota bacterium]
MFEFDWFSGSEIRTRVEADGRFQEAMKFAREYEPRSDVTYDWVVAHSSEEYKRYVALVDGLDSKADGLLKYLGAGTASFTLAISIPAGGLLDAWRFYPGLVFLVLSLFFAARARSPEKMPQPLTTTSAFKYADSYEKDIAQASFSAMTGAASVGLLVAAGEKGALVRKAYWWFVAAVSWIVFVSFLKAIAALIIV